MYQGFLLEDHINHPHIARKMAPNLALSTLEFIHDMILSNKLTYSQIANAAGCYLSTITQYVTKIELFRDVKAPLNKDRRPRRLTLIMLKALCDYLLKEPYLYLNEIVIFLWDKFQVHVTTSSISHALKYEGQSKKAAKYKAREQNIDLRDVYFHFMSDFCSYHLVYIDESRCDKRVGFRRTGWSPLRFTLT